MKEKYLVLERYIQQDLVAIEALFGELPAELAVESPEEELIVVGFRLHNLYNAFENIFKSIATTLDGDRGGDNAQLLQRMRLDLSPVRPAVLDDETYDRLDELRRFRHVYRSAYGLRLDGPRLALVLAKAQELRQIFPSRVKTLMDFLRQLQ